MDDSKAAAGAAADSSMTGSTTDASLPASSSSADLPSSPSSASMDAKARREARKARILGSGTDRLARITKTGRGGEAETLYSDPPKSTLGGGGSRSSSSLLHGQEDAILASDEDMMFRRAQAAMAGGALRGDAINNNNDEDDPGDVDISQARRGAGLQTQQQQGQQQQQEMPQDLQGMMQMMQNAMMGMGGGGGGTPGGMAGMMGGPPGGGNGGGGGGAPQQSPFAFPFGPPGGAGMGGAGTEAPPSAKTSLLEIGFNLLRASVFVLFGFALVYSALSGHAEAAKAVLEDESPAVVEKFEHMTTLHRWARLAYERPAHWEARYFGVESFGLPIHGIPVFWLFITLEIALQSSRIMLQRSRPTPPGFLLKATAYIPNAHIRLLIRTLASYLPLLDGFINDLAIVVFTIGCTVLFASWKVGLDPILAASDASLGSNVGLQEGGFGSGAASLGDKILDMNNPVMAGSAPLQGTL